MISHYLIQSDKSFVFTIRTKNSYFRNTYDYAGLRAKKKCKRKYTQNLGFVDESAVESFERTNSDRLYVKI